MRSKPVAVQFALIALVARGFLPAGWTSVAHHDVPVVRCSVTPAADILTDGHTGDGNAMPDRDDPRAQAKACGSARDPGVAAPDDTIFFTPVLQDGDLDDYNDAMPVHSRHRSHAPQAGRLPAV